VRPGQTNQASIRSISKKNPKAISRMMTMLHVSGTHTVGMRLAMEAARVCMRTMGERQIRTDTTLLQHYTTLKRIPMVENSSTMFVLSLAEHSIKIKPFRSAYVLAVCNGTLR
jgi:hypothetical protein